MAKRGITRVLARQMIIRSSGLAGKTPWSFVPGSPRKNKPQGSCKRVNFIVYPRTRNGVRLPGSLKKKAKHRRIGPTKDRKFFNGARPGRPRPAQETMQARR